MQEKPQLAKRETYEDLRRQLGALLEGEPNRVANAANCAALIYHGLPDVNWAGFYFLEGEQLVLGPFQGKTACIRIDVGRGVCGTAAQLRLTQVVPDVHDFPGHISCDADSRSEVVVPLVHRGQLVGVLDVDSPRRARFDAEDRAGLERLAQVFVNSL